MPRDDHFEEFEDHTLLKHFILNSYLAAWANILLGGTGRMERKFPRVLYVDAFAGAGCDEAGHPGSPLLAARRAEDINQRLFPDRVGSRTGMQVLAIEPDEDLFESLQNCLAPYTSMLDPFVTVRRGVLDAVALSEVRRNYPHDPTFFFVDPFGIDGLDASLLPGMLAGAHNEVLMLFSDEGAVRLHGKGAARPPEDLEARVRLVEQQPSLFGMEEHADRIADAKRSVDRILAGHKSNPRAREIMVRAFGDTAHVEIINATPVEQRQARMIALYSDLLRRSGAQRVLKFAVQTGAGRHKYTLLHASRQPRAFTVMKDMMHRARGQQPRADMGLLSETPLDPVVALVRERFAGRVARWQGTTPCVRDVAIEETDLMKHECEAFQLALEAFVIQRKPLTYQF